jgi:hypothetical protein
MTPHKPILISTDLVLATLDGSKTMTRRTKGLEYINECPERWKYIGNGGQFNEKFFFEIESGKHGFYCPYGKVGDLLWVKENHFAFGIWKVHGMTKTGKLKYALDIQDDDSIAFEEKIYSEKLKETFHLEVKPNNYRLGAAWFKRSSLFLSKKRARIWLKIEEIRVEPLQNISESDILNEGVRIPVSNKGTGNNKVVLELTPDINKALHFLNKDKTPTQYDLLFAFWAELWCKINGRGSWDANPWVWVIKFSRTEKPSDV